VLTYHNDIARTGQNLTEATLTSGNVTSATFGKLGFYSVDGLVDAEPLYASSVPVPEQRHTQSADRSDRERFGLRLRRRFRRDDLAGYDVETSETAVRQSRVRASDPGNRRDLDAGDRSHAGSQTARFMWWPCRKTDRETTTSDCMR
jgi:hypothetical protein